MSIFEGDNQKVFVIVESDMESGEAIVTLKNNDDAELLAKALGSDAEEEDENFPYTYSVEPVKTISELKRFYLVAENDGFGIVGYSFVCPYCGHQERFVDEDQVARKCDRCHKHSVRDGFL